MNANDTPPDSLVGALIDQKYRIERCIGRGGMGAVYEATNVAIGKRVALKFLEVSDGPADRDAVVRFQREAEAASAVESGHIVQIFDSGTTADDRPYLVMELLRGEDLRARLKRVGKLPESDVIHIAMQTLRALVRAHEAGIVHRDLKPDNLFLDSRDDDPLFVKVVDFGISKVTQTRAATNNTLTRRGTVLGTAYYMSPEQAQAFPDIDGRADLYSLGAICYEALTGEAPHGAGSYEAILVKACTQDAPDVRGKAPETSEAFAKVVAKALARDRADRYQDAREFLDALIDACPDLVRSGPVVLRSSRPNEAAPGQTAVVTAGGTTVPTTGRDRASRRTWVAALVAALGAFALTVLLMARTKPGADAEPARPAPGSTLPAAASAVPAPQVTPQPEPAESASAPAEPAADPSARPTESASPAETQRPGGAAKPRSTAVRGTKPATAPPKGTTGVASGLKLNPEEP
ncbi:MAG: protein kinase [Myxococcales bacterium]|nr:protein kinase [Myxococcales bacterium]